jgi:hypothetical protein
MPAGGRVVHGSVDADDEEATAPLRCAVKVPPVDR